MISRLLSLLITFAISAVAHASSPVAPRGVHRFALVVGANDGGSDRERLRYAGTDAVALSSVMSDLGGVARADRLVLADPTAEQLREAFVRLRKMVERARSQGDRVQFLFYYSGHSDERGLLLGGVVMSYRELRALVDAVPADVRLGVLDACASGAFTRLKGGRKQPSFLLGDGVVQGHAYLTSSSVDEAAQESDRIRGSFFTHYLLTGLRGAADVNRDKLVTLNEAYRFAYDETLARTERTIGGAQHAAYDIRLTGSGDLVMTDLRESSARLEIQPDVGGRLYVRDQAGNLAAELYKPPGAGAVVLALEPGFYRVTLDDGKVLYEAEVQVTGKAPLALGVAQFAKVHPEPAAARGSVPAESAYRIIPFDFGLVPPASINAIAKGEKVINNFGISIIYSQNARTYGMSLAMGGAYSSEEVRGLQLAMGASLTRDLKGVQVAIAVNVATGTVNGAQFSSGVNVARGLLRGAQFAQGVNVATSLVRGFQAAAGVNVATQSVSGSQVAAAANYAGSLRGAQLGVLNIAKGRVRGAQIGIINYAEEADASIAILPIVKKNGIAGDVWTSDTSLINVGLRLRATYTYAVLAAGIHPFGTGRGAHVGMILGGRIPIANVAFIDIDVGGHSVFSNFAGRHPPLLGKLRITAGGRIGSRLEIWGGPTANVLYQEREEDGHRPGYPWVTYEYRDGNDENLVRLWPGFVAGVRY